MAFGGILGTPQPQPGGLMGRLQTYMQNNPAAWMTLAGAFMAGKPGFAQIGQTMPVAMRADQMRLEDQRRRNAANMALKALSDAAKTNTAPVLPEGIDGADVPEGLLGRFFPDPKANRYGLNIQYGYRDGKLVALQPSETGGLIESAIPEGVTLAPPQQWVDTGTGFAPVPKYGQPSGPGAAGIVQKDVAGAAAQKEVGEGAGKAAVNLPVVENTASTMVKMIDDLASDPYLPSMTGPFDSWLPNVTGEANRVQAKADQVIGQAFLAAYERLKGAGQITEQEGAAATAAMTRLKSMGVNDEDYMQALADLKAEVGRLVELARRKAGMAPAPAPANAPATDLKSKYGLE